MRELMWLTTTFADVDGKKLLGNVLGLIQDFATLGGAVWTIWGVVILASGLKDKNGPQLQSGIWQIIGGLMIISAAILFGTLT